MKTRILYVKKNVFFSCPSIPQNFYIFQLGLLYSFPLVWYQNMGHSYYWTSILAILLYGNDFEGSWTVHIPASQTNITWAQSKKCNWIQKCKSHLYDLCYVLWWVGVLALAFLTHPCTVQYYRVLHCIVVCWTVLHCGWVWCTVMNCWRVIASAITVQECSGLHYTVEKYVVLHCRGVCCTDAYCRGVCCTELHLSVVHFISL